MSKVALSLFLLVLVVCLSAAASLEEGRHLSEDTAPLRSAREAERRRRRKGKGRRRALKKNGNRKRKPKSSRKSKSASRMEDPVSYACMEKSLTIMKMWKDVITNFEKQKTRMEKQNGTGGKKSGKKGLFAPIALRLVDIGGGNKSALSCGGSTDNDGAKQLTNLTETLFKCEMDVHDACDPSNFPQPNMTFLMMCDSLVTKFKTGAMECLSKSIGGTKTDSTDACSCWTNTTLAETVEAAKMCKANEEAKAIATALKNCTKTFGQCRKFEDDAITSIMSCKDDSSKLAQKAATLSTNVGAVKSVSNKTASLTASSRIVNWNFTISNCSEVITYATKLADVASSFPSSPMISTIAEKITSTGSISCSDEEKASLMTVQTSLDSAVTTIENALEAVQEQLMTLTGSTASTEVLASAGSLDTDMTTKATRRRNFVRF